MKQFVTTAIVLSRTDYGEADRIITLLTPDYGKLRLVGRGVRRVKSKMAGGIELFSVSDVTFIQGKGELGTLISARLRRHYAAIATDITRTMLGYELIKQLNRVTEDQPEATYFALLEQTFAALDDSAIAVEVIREWFGAQLLRLGGHMPNLRTDNAGHRLSADQTYEYDSDAAAFRSRPDGPFTADHIKFLRLLCSDNQPSVLQKVAGVEGLVADTGRLVTLLTQQYIQ